MSRGIFTGGKNESQVLAINRALAVLETSEGPQIQVIHGPPGTGKTTTVVGLIVSAIALRRGYRVYASAPTNYAVCELAKRTLKVQCVCSYFVLLLTFLTPP
jgi:ATP-dependent RNA/DNA helicase IGHMBP2